MHYLIKLVALFACVIMSSGAVAENPAPAKAQMCVACHGAGGQSTNPLYPILAGQHSLYLKKQLTDFKSGKRADPVMAPMAKALTEGEIAELAEYYSKAGKGQGAE